jgi:hypothetical protein
MIANILLSDGNAEKSLADDDQREVAEIMHHWDMNNNGISRNDAITLIMYWTGCNDHVKAKNHFAYLVQKIKLQDLKHDGRVMGWWKVCLMTWTAPIFQRKSFTQ